MSLDAFLAQAAEYETQGTVVDKVWQVINTAFKTHPFGTVRAAELQRWIARGDYGRIVAGDYPRRGSEGDRPLGADYADAADYYGQQARDAVGSLNDTLARARDAFNQAFRGPGQGGAL